MRRKWTRVAVVLGVAATIASSTIAPSTGPHAVAAALPTASCYDGLYYDGLESRNTASRCATAAAAKKYDAAAYHNASAQSQMARMPSDAVYYFSGHAIVVSDLNTGGAPYAAVGLMHESPRAGGNVDALVGDPVAAPLLQGPQELCDESGRDCRDVTLASYPWASELTKHNLVVLQSCNTAGSNSLFAGMAETAQQAGAGTVIGFRNLVGFPAGCRDCDLYGIKWARVFWQSLQAGATYTSATISATNAVGGAYGYSSYRILRNPDSPQRLGPAQYYVWPAGPVAVPAAGTSNDPALDAALMKWLGSTPVAGAWQSDSAATAETARTYRPGLGLFQIDKTSGEVTEAVFESEADGGTQRIPSRTAVDVAQQFVHDHEGMAPEMALRDVELNDHGAFTEYTVTWQERRDNAWLPARITVGVNANTGRVHTFSKDTTWVEVDTDASVTEEQAERSAKALLAGDGWTEHAEPRLEVTVDHQGAQRLVWVHEFARAVEGTGVPQGVGIWTDARSGKSFIQVRS